MLTRLNQLHLHVIVVTEVDQVTVLGAVAVAAVVVVVAAVAVVVAAAAAAVVLLLLVVIVDRIGGRVRQLRLRC